jgi:lipopolysaccharide/colanic/teichoic acid biosynthesis glycosyltransferase
MQRSCLEFFSSLQLKMKIRIIRNCILAADLLLLAPGALGLAIVLRYAGTRDGIRFLEHSQAYLPMMLVVFGAWTFLYFEMNLDGFKGGWLFSTILANAIVGVFLLMMVVLTLAFLTQHYYSRLVLLYFVIFFVFGLIGERFLVQMLMVSRLRNVPENRCVILGNGHVARELADKIATHPELPFHVVGFLFPSESEASNWLAGPLGTPANSVKTLQVLDLLARQEVRKIIIAMPQPGTAEVRKLIAECRRSSIQIYLVPQWYDLYLSKADLLDIDGLPLLSLQQRNPSHASAILKRAMDIVLSGGILFLVSPLVLIAALFLYVKKGKAFRAELRCGQDGIPFRMYRLNVDRRAPNLESYERFLVRWSLTELPQLWNVWRGDMSLVGPRPESVERLKCYSEWQRQRLRVRGGITGLAQVHGLREQHSSEDKARFDLQYILRWSPFLDLSLILQTVWTLLSRGLTPHFAATQEEHSRSEASGRVPWEAVDANRS